MFFKKINKKSDRLIVSLFTLSSTLWLISFVVELVNRKSFDTLSLVLSVLFAGLSYLNYIEIMNCQKRTKRVNEMFEKIFIDLEKDKSDYSKK